MEYPNFSDKIAPKEHNDKKHVYAISFKINELGFKV